MFGDLSFSHILILLLVLVLVFGAKRIPEIGSSFQGVQAQPQGHDERRPARGPAAGGAAALRDLPPLLLERRPQAAERLSD